MSRDYSVLYDVITNKSRVMPGSRGDKPAEEVEDGFICLVVCSFVAYWYISTIYAWFDSFYARVSTITAI